MPKKTVMTVDDSETLLKLVEDILVPEGYNVVKARNGEEALKKLKKTKVDLVLIDYFMPGMNGVELLEEIRADKDLKKLKCAFLTIGVFKKVGERWIKKLNSLDYIKKPFKYKDLIKRVDRMIKL